MHTVTVFKLSLRMQPEDAAQYEPEELRTLGPRNLSFWVASNFRETPQQQQILLQVWVL